MRAAAAGLAAAELVGALDRGRGGRAQVGAAPAAGQGEEAAERELHRVADGLAHRPAEGVGVAGHLVDDRGDDRARRRRGSSSRICVDGLGREVQPVVGGPAWHGAVADRAHYCLQRTNVTWSFTSDGQEFTPRRSTLEVMATIDLPAGTRHPDSGASRCASACARLAEAAVTPLDARRRPRRLPPAALRRRPARPDRLGHAPRPPSPPRSCIKPGRDWTGHVPGQYVRDRRRRRRRPPVAHLLPDPRPARRPLHQPHRQGDPRRRRVQLPRAPRAGRRDAPARAGRGRVRAARSRCPTSCCWSPPAPASPR